MNRHLYYLERARCLLDRGLTFGPEDWTVDFEKQAKTLLGDMAEELGLFDKCESCAGWDYCKPTEVRGSNPDVLRLCGRCRHDAGWDTREAA